jgi:hypothetical protein
MNKGIISPASFHSRDNSTYKFQFTTFLKLESHYNFVPVQFFC